MSQATVTITLPPTRADGSTFAPQDYGGAHIFRDSTQVGTATGPSLVFVDPTDLAPGTYAYTATVFDTNGLESDPSDPVSVTVQAVASKPSKPTISVTLA